MLYLYSTCTSHALTYDIVQGQVDGGVPIGTCIYLFKQWVREVEQKNQLVMMEPGVQYTGDQQLCAIATWSGTLLTSC